MEKLCSFIITLFLTFAMFLPNTSAQDYTKWDLPEGATRRIGKGKIYEIKYSPDGNLLAVASSIGIWLYDAETDKELDLLTGHTSVVFSSVFLAGWQNYRKRKLGRYRAIVGCYHRTTSENTHRAY